MEQTDAAPTTNHETAFEDFILGLLTQNEARRIPGSFAMDATNSQHTALQPMSADLASSQISHSQKEKILTKAVFKMLGAQEVIESGSDVAIIREHFEAKSLVAQYLKSWVSESGTWGGLYAELLNAEADNKELSLALREAMQDYFRNPEFKVNPVDSAHANVQSIDKAMENGCENIRASATSRYAADSVKKFGDIWQLVRDTLLTEKPQAGDANTERLSFIAQHIMEGHAVAEALQSGSVEQIQGIMRPLVSGVGLYFIATHAGQSPQIQNIANTAVLAAYNAASPSTGPAI